MCKLKTYFLFLTTSLFVVIALTACEIEQYDVSYSLSAPLGLNAYLTNSISTVITNSTTNTYTNNYFKLGFWGFNSEPYFSGYKVYTADSLSDLTNKTNSYRGIYDQSDVSNTLTLAATPVSTEATYYTIAVSNDTLTNTNYLYTDFVHSNTYYFFVMAYGDDFDAYSVPSNPTNITYLTNWTN